MRWSRMAVFWGRGSREGSRFCGEVSDVEGSCERYSWSEYDFFFYGSEGMATYSGSDMQRPPRRLRNFYSRDSSMGFWLSKMP